MATSSALHVPSRTRHAAFPRAWDRRMPDAEPPTGEVRRVRAVEDELRRQCATLGSLPTSHFGNHSGHGPSRRVRHPSRSLSFTSVFVCRLLKLPGGLNSVCSVCAPLPAATPARRRQLQRTQRIFRQRLPLQQVTRDALTAASSSPTTCPVPDAASSARAEPRPRAEATRPLQRVGYRRSPPAAGASPVSREPAT